MIFDNTTIRNIALWFEMFFIKVKLKLCWKIFKRVDHNGLFYKSNTITKFKRVPFKNKWAISNLH